jgi:membrane-anchored protein YejM (alkaline phosphatase superfamily)
MTAGPTHHRVGQQLACQSVLSCCVMFWKDLPARACQDLLQHVHFPTIYLQRVSHPKATNLTGFVFLP